MFSILLSLLLEWEKASVLVQELEPFFRVRVIIGFGFGVKVWIRV